MSTRKFKCLILRQLFLMSGFMGIAIEKYYVNITKNK